MAIGSAYRPISCAFFSISLTYFSWRDFRAGNRSQNAAVAIGVSLSISSR